MAIKVHGATVIDNSKHITVSGAQVDGTLLLPEAGLLQVSKDNGSIGQFGASDTELITIGNSSNNKNIILRSSGFADFKQVNVNQILKVGGDNVQINPDGSSTFAGTVAVNELTIGGSSVNTSAEVDAKIAAIPGADLSGYDTSVEVDAKIAAIPATDLSGYDTSTEVDAKIAAIPSVDLGGYDTSAQVNAKIANLENALINGAPEALNTLVELSTALGDDANFATTITNSLAGKADLSGATFTGTVDAPAFTVNGSPLEVSGSQTIISDTAPSTTDNDVGTLWWNSDSSDGSLYVLYQDPSGPAGDAGGKYWIEASPAPDSIGFNGSHTGDSVFNGNVDVTGNVTATYFMGNLSGNLLNSQGQVVIDADNPDFGLPFSGGTMTGAIQMGATASSDGGSVYFDGNGDSLSVADNADFDFGTGDFTIELFANTSTGIATNPVLIGASGGWYVQIKTNGTILEFYDGSTSIQATGLDLKGAWHHIAVTKESNVVKIFVDGVLKTTASNSNIINLANTLYIGNYGGGGLNYLGYISNVRVIKGTSLYAVDFTPSTSNLTAISGTSLLCCQSKDSETQEATGKTISINGNTASSTESPFSGPAPSVIGVDGNATFAGTVNATYFVGDLSGKLLNSQGQVVIDADNPDFGFDGNLTGDLDVTGTGTFTGTVNTGVWPNNSSTSLGGGAYMARQDTGTSVVWKAFSGGTGDSYVTSQIKADGSATFASHLITGSANSVTSTSEHGSYIGEGVVVNAIQPNAVTAAQERVWLGKLANVTKSEIFKDGSATFAGDLTLGSYNTGSNGVRGLFYTETAGLTVQAPAGTTQSLLKGLGGNSSDVKFNILADGSATFVGEVSANTGAFSRDVTNDNVTILYAGNDNGIKFAAKGNGTYIGTSLTNINNATPTGSNITLSTDGSATFNSTIQSGEYAAGAAGSIQIFNNTASAQAFKVGNTTNGSNIVMKSDGTATFGAFNQSSTSGNGTIISHDGQVTVQRPSGSSSYLFRGFQGTTEKYFVKADGSAEFAGGNINLYSNGSAIFAAGATFGNDVNTSTQFTIENSGVEKFRVNSDGSCFIGNPANSGNTSSTNRRVLISAVDGSASFAGNGEFNRSVALKNGYGADTDNYAALYTRNAADDSTTFMVNYDGSATFAGGAIELKSSGQVYSNRTVGTGACFYGNLNGSNTSSILADGSADFVAGKFRARNVSGAGVLELQTSAGTQKVLIDGRDGSATFSGQLQIGGGESATYGYGGIFYSNGGSTSNLSTVYARNMNSGGRVWAGDNSVGATTSQIYGNGSASFNSHITVNGGVNSGSTTNYGSVRYGGGEYYAQTASATSSTTDMIRIYYGTSVTTRIRANGEAKFDGTVSVGSFNTGSNGTQGADLVKGLVQVQQPTANSSNNGLWAGYHGVTQTSVIRAGGNAFFSGNITAGNVSDIKFKENITDANPQLSDVVALGGILKNWDWKEEAPLNEELRAKRFLGLVAQEAEEICPGIVYDVHRKVKGEELTPETTDEDGNVTPATYEEVDDSYKAINHDILVMKLLGAIAELEAKVAALEAG